MNHQPLARFWDVLTELDPTNELRCPDCVLKADVCYSHPYEVVINQGGVILTLGPANTIAVTHGEPSGRGSRITLRFRCEISANFWSHHFQFHKGMTFHWSEIDHHASDEIDDWPPREFWRD